VTLSTLLRGSVYERLRWAFRLYDVDGDGAITRQELAEVVVAVHELLGRRAPQGSPAARLDDAKANEQVMGWSLWITMCDGFTMCHELQSVMDGLQFVMDEFQCIMDELQCVMDDLQCVIDELQCAMDEFQAVMD
jgi:hypothetical protein